MGKSVKGKRRRRRGLKPGQRHGGSFERGANAHNGAVAQRGPDLLPRKQVVALAQASALFGEQIRDPRSGRLSRSKWATAVRGAGLRDFIRWQRRALYAGAHGDADEAATLSAGVVRIGEFFGAYLDDKPATGPRVTKIVLSTDEPSHEVPPDAGQRRLSAPTPAEAGYVEVREEDVP